MSSNRLKIRALMLKASTSSTPSRGLHGQCPGPDNRPSRPTAPCAPGVGLMATLPVLEISPGRAKSDPQSETRTWRMT